MAIFVWWIETLEALVKILGAAMVEILFFIAACVMARQSFGAFRSAFKGTEPGKSATSNVIWGLMSGAISLTCFWLCVFVV